MSTYKDLKKIFFIKMHHIECRFVTGPSDVLFAGVYVCTFLPGNFTGWGTEGVKRQIDALCYTWFCVDELFFYVEPFGSNNKEGTAKYYRGLFGQKLKTVIMFT